MRLLFLLPLLPRRPFVQEGAGRRVRPRPPACAPPPPFPASHLLVDWYVSLYVPEALAASYIIVALAPVAPAILFECALSFAHRSRPVPICPTNILNRHRRLFGVQHEGPAIDGTPRLRHALSGARSRKWEGWARARSTRRRGFARRKCGTGRPLALGKLHRLAFWYVYWDLSIQIKEHSVYKSNTKPKITICVSNGDQLRRNAIKVS